MKLRLVQDCGVTQVFFRIHHRIVLGHGDKGGGRLGRDREVPSQVLDTALGLG